MPARLPTTITPSLDGWRAIEPLRVVATADRAVLVYDDLPITPT